MDFSLLLKKIRGSFYALISVVLGHINQGLFLCASAREIVPRATMQTMHIQSRANLSQLTDYVNCDRTVGGNMSYFLTILIVPCRSCMDNGKGFSVLAVDENLLTMRK
jgi:hypothetical protein